MKTILNKKFQLEETLSAFYRSFLTIDKRMRKNIIIISGMIMILILTGVIVALLKVYQLGASFIDAKFSSNAEVTLMTKIDRT